MVIDELDFQFSDGWAHIIYEDDIVTVTDDQGLLIKFAYPHVNNINPLLYKQSDMRNLLILQVGVRISKVDVIRMLHRDLKDNLSVLEYKIGTLEKKLGEENK